MKKRNFWYARLADVGGYPCEHCGKWQGRKVCRRDRRRLKQARQAVAAVGRPSYYARAWRVLCWPFLFVVSILAFMAMLYLLDESDSNF